MSFAEIQNENAALDASERRRLIAYMLTLQNAGDEDRKSRLSGKIDNGLESWVEFEDLKDRLSGN